MRNFITALLIALVLFSSRLHGAAPDNTSAQVALRPVSLREAISRISAPSHLQDAAQQSDEDSDRWMERHPVWFGLIVGASAGAVFGAVSCAKGCFPIGAGGAAIVGSAWGAGPGALIGWGVSKSRD
jgi:hypothetical protein